MDVGKVEMPVMCSGRMLLDLWLEMELGFTRSEVAELGESRYSASGSLALAEPPQPDSRTARLETVQFWFPLERIQV